MRMKRNLSLAVGILATIFGLSVAVDTAYGCGCCCCCCCCNPCPGQAFNSCGTGPCYTPNPTNQHMCSDATTPGLCGNAEYLWIDISSFPMGSCQQQNGSTCNQVLTNCWIGTSCKFVNGACVDNVQGGLWNKMPMWVTGTCP